MEIGYIALFYSTTWKRTMQLKVLSPLTSTVPINLKFDSTRIPDDTLVVLKGDDVTDALDPSHFTCSGMSTKQSLVANGDGNLVLKAVTYSVSLYVVDPTYYSQIINVSNSSISPNGTFTQTLQFEGSYAGKYVFPQLTGRRFRETYCGILVDYHGQRDETSRRIDRQF